MDKYTTYDQVPWYRKNWFIVLSVLFFAPASLYPLFTGDVYYQKKGELCKYSRLTKIISIIIACMSTLWLVGAVMSSFDKTPREVVRDDIYDSIVSTNTMPKEKAKCIANKATEGVPDNVLAEYLKSIENKNEGQEGENMNPRTLGAIQVIINRLTEASSTCF